MALIEIDDFPSDRNLHLWLGFSMAMLNNQRVSWGILNIVLATDATPKESHENYQNFHGISIGCFMGLEQESAWFFF